MNARAHLPFVTCVDDALGLAHGWMSRWVAQLVSVLAQQESCDTGAPGKRAVTQTRATLVACSDRLAQLWHQSYVDAVRTEMSGDGTNVGASIRPSAKTLSLDALELMDHRQVQTSVELARLHQVVKGAVDDELIALTALLCSARGLPNVRPEANPLRPEVAVDALMSALAQLNVDDATRQRWLHEGAPALGKALQAFYAGLVQGLESQGIQPAGFVVVPVVSARGPAPSQAKGFAQTAQATASEGPLVLTLDHLHQLLVGNLANAGPTVSDGGVSGSGNAMVRTLAAEVVSLMLRQIADDRRLLAPVREMVQQLKPALLHLAKNDPRFFADRRNPARQLLETITERSLGFRSEQDTGFSDFAELVHQTVQSLQTLSPGLPERIADCVKRLEPPKDQSEGHAVATLVRVEQRHLLAERIAAEIRARADFVRAPALVKKFLLGPWSQVVAHARLHVDGLGEAPMITEMAPHASDPAERYMDVLGDLLWSCQLSQASLDRPRLIRVVPAVLRCVREGLDSIDFPREEAEPFFQVLMGLHEAAYKTHRSEEFLAALQRRESAASPEPWFQGREARESGFIDTQVMEMPEFVDTEPMPQDAGLGATLEVGAWVEIEQYRQVQRCQLRWTSPHRTMFLFATAVGMPVSLTRQGLDRLARHGKLRVVAEVGVVDEALRMVAKLAWINSGKLA